MHCCSHRTSEEDCAPWLLSWVASFVITELQEMPLVIWFSHAEMSVQVMLIQSKQDLTINTASPAAMLLPCGAQPEGWLSGIDASKKRGNMWP